MLIFKKLTVKLNLQKSLFMILFSVIFFSQVRSQCAFGNFPATYTQAASFGANYLLGTKFSLSTTSTLTGLGYQGNGTGAGMQMAIYTDAAGIAGNLVAASSLTTNASGTTILNIATPTVVPAGNYWIMAVYNGASLNHVSYTTATTKTVCYVSLTFGTPPPATASWITYTGQDFNYWGVFAGTPPAVAINTSTGSICIGSTVSLTASGASSYVWNTGATTTSITPTPTVTTAYSVIGTNTIGCFSNVTKTITVNPLPTVAITVTAMACSGSPVSLTASGASFSYSWSTGAISPSVTVTPTVLSTYTVTGVDFNGCINTAVKTVSVNALPTLSVSSTNALLCSGQTATITANGANTYTWSTSSNSVSIIVTPSVTTNYTVVGTNTLGCNNASIITQSVSACTGVASYQNSATEIKAYPNPTNGNVTIELSTETTLFIYNSIGEIIMNEVLQAGDHQINLSAEANGVYMVKAINGHSVSTLKIIKD